VVAERGFDALIVAVAVLSEVELVFGEVPGPRWLLVPGVLLYTLPLLLRRRFPFLAPAFAFGVQIALTFADPQAVGSLDTGSIALLLTFWAVGERNEGQLAVAGLGIGLGTIAIVTVVDVRVGLGQAVNAALLGTMAWLFALLLARRGRRAAAAEAHAAQLERDHEQHTQAAAATERRRIARALHDVIAHSVSVMTVQAGAARMQLPDHPDRAVPPLMAVEETGRQALAELRRLLGILRENDAPALAPQPGLTDLPTLAEAMDRAGVDVDLRVEGQPRPLPASLNLTAYRIVQEALTNTLKHAGPARASVVIHYDPDALRLKITDDGQASPATTDGSGHGLLGMRERAAGDTLLAPAITRRLVEQYLRRPPPGSRTPPGLSALTDRELEVLRLVARGRSNQQIASTLFLGESTVKTHLTHLFAKLGLRDRAQAVVLAYESGLIQPGDD
jgi:signal transduction histidine kinase/DNA-binding CsgD family transcriptional regulator